MLERSHRFLGITSSFCQSPPGITHKKESDFSFSIVVLLSLILTTRRSKVDAIKRVEGMSSDIRVGANCALLSSIVVIMTIFFGAVLEPV